MTSVVSSEVQVIRAESVPASFSVIVCRVCGCKILRQQYATERVSVARSSLPSECHDAIFNEGEAEAEFWSVKDMFDFENIGFLKTVDKCKLLTCADCEKEPLGVHVVDVEPKRYLMRTTRLRHQ